MVQFKTLGQIVTLLSSKKQNESVESNKEVHVLGTSLADKNERKPSATHFPFQIIRFVARQKLKWAQVRHQYDLDARYNYFSRQEFIEDLFLDANAVPRIHQPISRRRRPEKSDVTDNVTEEIEYISRSPQPIATEPLVRFRRAVKTVQVLLKATIASRQGGQRPELLSWAHYQEEDTRRAYSNFGVSFDPSIFKASRENMLSNEAKAILSMDPKDRTEDQLHVALVALNTAVEAFGEFPIQMQQSLVRVGWYEHFEAKRVIIRQGHTADNFYFILSGTAIVTILETNKTTGEQFIQTVALLKKGNSFGELALMHGARRSATVTCKDDVELLAVGREDFIDIFMHAEKDEEPEHIQYLRTLGILRGWPVHTIPHNDPKTCLFTYFRRGVLLCKDSNTSEWVYFIKTGSCRVLKGLHATKPNIPGLEYVEYGKDKLPPIHLNGSRSSTSSSMSLDSESPRSLNSKKGHGSTYKRHVLQSKGLPPIRTRSEEELHASAEEHIKRLDSLFEKRHTFKKVKKSPKREVASDTENGGAAKKSIMETVFVQIQKLGAKDVFGLEQVAFSLIGTTTGASLVSDGAECILVNKKFFQQHLTDEVAKRIRRTLQPLPSEESLQQKLQDNTNWEAFKTMTVSNHVTYRKQLQGHDSLYY